MVPAFQPPRLLTFATIRTPQILDFVKVQRKLCKLREELKRGRRLRISNLRSLNTMLLDVSEPDCRILIEDLIRKFS